MQQNSTKNWFRSQLDAYCENGEPGYALLIDAPWGSGKTHAIKEWASGRSDTVYVSLYGISSFEQLEERLLEAIVSRDSTLKTPKIVQTVESIAGKLRGQDLRISHLYRRVALNAAPAVMIVDDLERTSLSANAVLGTINSFLEHKGRNVILIGHQAELSLKWTGDDGNYLRIKEKVIGRILPFYPELNEVLAAFIKQIEESGRRLGLLRFLNRGPYYDYAAMLKSEIHFLALIFKRTQSSNLRLLKQSLRDFAQIYPILIDLVGNDQAKVRKVLGSYLALSVLYHGGKLTSEEALQQEVSWRRFVQRDNKGGDEVEVKEEIEVARELFLGLEEVILDGSIITPELAVRSIAKGDFTKEFVAEELLKSPYLVPAQANAWRILWQWQREKPDTVSSALESVVKSLNQKDFRDPVQIVHVFCILRSMEESGVKLPLKESVEKYFESYIADLATTKSVEFMRPITKFSRSITDENETGLGFVKEDGAFFKRAVRHIEEAMDKLFWDHLKSDPSWLLAELRESPIEFLRSLDDRGRGPTTANYAHIPVVAFMRPENVLIELLEHGPTHVGTFIGVMQRRVPRLEKIEAESRTFEWPKEREWLTEFCKELSRRSIASAGTIASSQLAVLTRYCEDALKGLPE